MTATGGKQPVTLTTPDPTAERVAALRALFPDTMADGRIDFDKLRSLLGEAVAAGPERFTFSWAGRADAAALLQMPSRATLVPKPKESVNWDATRNLFIEGDNLEVLKLLYRAYAGKVKLIYIDPPYNTGNDFVYPDDFADPLAVYLKLTGQADEAGKLLTSNPETSGRYHSAWLSMMYPRLFLARQLLRDDGVIFVSIDDHEVHHLRLLMNEVFGEENFVATCIWQKVFSPKNSAKHFSEDHDFMLVYEPEEFEAALIATKERPRLPYGWTTMDLAQRRLAARPIRLLNPELEASRYAKGIVGLAIYLQEIQKEEPILLPVEQVREWLAAKKVVVAGTITKLVQLGILEMTKPEYNTGSAREFMFRGVEGKHYVVDSQSAKPRLLKAKPNDQKKSE